MAREMFLCASTVLDASMRDRIQAAAQGGYAGLGLRPGHVRRAIAEGYEVDELRGDLRAHDLEVVEIGFVSEWWADGEAGASASLPQEQALHRLKQRCGGRHMMAIAGPLDDGLDAAAARFGAMCRRAGEHGLRVALEFLPWTDVDTLEKAWALVEASGVPNAAIALDTWHFFRGGSTLDMIGPVPADRIAVVQLSDGPLGPLDDELDATFRLRRLPGEGEFDLTGLLTALREKGVTAPVGVEVLSDELRALDPVDAASRAADAATALLSETYR